MSDTRFSRLKSDPRFRNLRRKAAKVVVDERFKDVVSQKEKRTGRVDKYGRPLSRAHERDNLRRFYRLEGEEDVLPASDKTTPDLARGEALLESSDEESASEASPEEDFEDAVVLGHGPSRPIPVTQADAEIDLDETILAELDAQASAYTVSHPDEYSDGGTATPRIAVVNLDWEHVRASHLYKIFSSVLSSTTPADSSVSLSITKHTRPRKRPVHAKNGGILNVRVFTSEFGRQRLALEEKHGPPAEIFKKEKNLCQEEINEETIYEVGQEDDCDEDALRKYQLERLRYYYAIVTCDSVETASYVYSELEGTELERSANVFDLSFVPEDMTFDGDIRDQATESSDVNYRGLDFVTDALRHSKVKLTWDEDDPERDHITRRALSRKEIEDADFRAYLASSGSESEHDDGPKRETRLISREKLRATLLGGNNHEMPEGWGDQDDDGSDVDMEITFTPGLSEKHNADETTLDKYQRKRREKRKKKSELKEDNVTREGEHPGDDFFEPTGGPKSPNIKNSLPPPEERSSLAAADDIAGEPQHFNLKSIIKADKQSKRKGKRRPKPILPEEDNEIQEGFSIDVNDSRFKALHEDHNYAIDPSHPQFKKTKGMSALLEERSKRHRATGTGVPITVPPKRKEPGGDLKTLVESIKRKSTTIDRGSGKRRKQENLQGYV